MTKEELRKAFLQKRKALGEEEYRKLNQMLCDRFFASVNLSDISVLHTFLPIPANNEPDTWLIINRLRREFPHIHVAVPRVNHTELEHLLLESVTQLTTGTWGVPEPRSGKPVHLRAIDMVLVPLLAFDIRGHRVGYGKGYYDRFLAACPVTTQRIGLSFFDPVESIPTTPSDTQLTACVTPNRFFQFT